MKCVVCGRRMRGKAWRAPNPDGPTGAAHVQCPFPTHGLKECQVCGMVIDPKAKTVGVDGGVAHARCLGTR
jgi:hypothetical protein